MTDQLGLPPQLSPLTTTPASVAAPPARERAFFPKSRRVRDRKDFQRIQTRGIRVCSQPFLVLAMKQPGSPQPARLGITASKKSGESVARSRIKRVLREAFRLHQREFPSGWDFVVIAREGGDKLTLSVVVAALQSAIEKLARDKDKPRPPPHSRSGPRKPPKK